MTVALVQTRRKRQADDRERDGETAEINAANGFLFYESLVFSFVVRVLSCN